MLYPLAYNIGMISDEKTIYAYRKANGQTPFKVWLDGLKDKKAKAAVIVRLARLRAGNPGDWKALSNDLYELRIPSGPGYRIYFAIEGGKIYLLLSASNKTDQVAEIKKAEKYLKDYRSRENENPQSRIDTL